MAPSFAAMSESRGTGPIIPLIAAVLLLLVVGDRLWRLRQRSTPPATPAGISAAPATDLGNVPAGRPPVSPLAGGGAARQAVRERLRQAAAGTYLPEMLAENDSVLLRWPARAGRTLRVAVVRQGAEGYVESFAGAVSWAVTRWNGVGLPVQLETGADSAGADIVVAWVASLGAGLLGRAEVTWNGKGEVVRVALTLATHAPDGTPLSQRLMVTLALHELGHTLGLGHSPDRADALFPTSTATELTPRDRRTATLLYDLPTGSLKN
jgi:hypothetical protein